MFKARFILLMMLLIPVPQLSWGVPVRDTCIPFSESEKPFARDYTFYEDKKTLLAYAKEVYEASRRLQKRAYWNADAESLVVPYGTTDIKVSAKFWQGLSGHITQALKRDYANAVVYPDLGHAHLLLPTAAWEAIKNNNSSNETRMEKVLASDQIQFLYHTAEMIQVKDGDFTKGTFPQDPWKLWRYFSRNLLGTTQNQNSLEVVWAGEKAIYNTVRSMPGMTEVSTVYFISNHRGCLPYQLDTTTQFFDFTFATIPYEVGRAPSNKKLPHRDELH